MVKSYQLLKFASVAIWSGVALLFLGILLSFPTFAPYFDSLRYTSEIAPAPLLTATNPGAQEILPFGEEVYSVADLLQPEPPTPTPTPPPAVSGIAPETPAPLPTVTPTPTPTGVEPTYIRIPTLNLEAPVVPIGWEMVNAQPTWQVPDWKAVGWHDSSALLGVSGNTVLNGHNTTRGEVFRDLYKLQPDDTIILEGQDGSLHTYIVNAIYILQEADQPLEVRLENARYIQSTLDERLTLVTCHPYSSTRYRLLVIAFPALASELMHLQGE